MTNKKQVDLDTYRNKKKPRLLAEAMEMALRPEGALRPVLDEIIKDDELRLDIRERRFNVYFQGGNLMRVDGRRQPWELHFDEKYFKGGAPQTPKDLPMQFSTIDDAHAWVNKFSYLKAGMTNWWTQPRHRKGERVHCQQMATTNSSMAGAPSADYLVLDLEYEWAKRRFDMIAAKRRPTENDMSGWAEPDLVFVEVKSDENACCHNSGLLDHAVDYRDIIMSGGGQSSKNIKIEFQNVIAQKTRLGLLGASLGFKRFFSAVPELLVVFVNLDPNKPLVQKALAKIRDELDEIERIRFMQLALSNYVMYSNTAMPLESLIAEGA